MQGAKQYRIIYTRSAVCDMNDKVDYMIFQYRDSKLAENWYLRLKKFIEENLSSFPNKYAIYEKMQSVMHIIRYVPFKNDIIFYYVDEEHIKAVILAICTKGQAAERHLEQLVH